MTEKILLLNNNFFGSYCSNQYFYNELSETLMLMEQDFVMVNTVEEAVRELETGNVAFSVCLGVYDYYLDNKPLYDIYSVPDYQWISDDPLKFNIDYNSPNIRYVFIDEQFPLVADGTIHKPLILPLGFMPEKKKSPDRNKKNGILFPGQVRSLDQIISKIEKSAAKYLIYDFIDNYDFDSSYIGALKAACTDLEDNVKHELFSNTNSYIRTRKRIAALESISTVPVYVAGEKADNTFSSDNIYFIGKYDYTQIESVMNEYEFVLNVDPNYHSCVHERISRGVNAGSLVISNENNIVNNSNGFPCAYRFDDKSSIDRIIADAKNSMADYFEREERFIQNCSWKSSLERIIYDYKSKQ